MTTSPAEQDPPAVRLDDADHHAEGRGLPRAVAAQQPDDLALVHLEAHLVHDLSLAVDLGDPVDLQEVLPVS